MARPLGSKNKTPRELETDGKNLIEKAKLKRQIESLKGDKKK